MSEPQLYSMIEALKKQLQSQAAEIATLRYERDLARAKALSLLPVATPEEEAAFVKLMETAVPNGLADLITELEQSGPTHGR